MEPAQDRNARPRGARPVRLQAGHAQGHDARAYRMPIKGGDYWGGVGRDPAIDRYFDSGGRANSRPAIHAVQTGGGNYCGILVALLAAFAVAQSFRRKNSPFSETQKRFIWFWAGRAGRFAADVAWGRFAPAFYEMFYALPYASTIRNPAKFVLTAGVGDRDLVCLRRPRLEPALSGGSRRRFRGGFHPAHQLVGKVRGFDRKWTLACVGIFGGSVLAWLIYAAQKPASSNYLQIRRLPRSDSGRDNRQLQHRPGRLVPFDFCRRRVSDHPHPRREFFPASAHGSAASCSAFC